MIVIAAGVLLSGWMPWLPSPLMPALGALASLCLRPLAPGLAALLFSFLAGFAYGCAWGQSLLDAQLSPQLEVRPLAASFRILEPPQQRWVQGRPRQRFAAEVKLLRCPDDLPACRRKVGRVLLSYYGELPLRAGQRWQGELRLKRSRGLANPGSFNYEAWLARHRFAATGYVRDRPLHAVAGGAAWWQLWRQRVADSLQQDVDDPELRGVLLALGNGDRSGISQARWQQFQRYGLNHLVVISGLHVGLVAGLGFMLGRLFSRRTGHGCAALLALAYSALAGFALPTQRALVMLASVQLVALARRRVAPARSLSAALLVVALLDPLATHGAGFWLSFGAVALIFYLRHMQPQLSGWRLLLALQLVLAPSMGVLASAWFGGLGWVAPLANLVAVPVLSLWLAPLSLLGAVLAPLDLAAPVWGLASVPVAGFFALDTELAGRLPLWVRLRPDAVVLPGLTMALLLALAHRALPCRWLAVAWLLVALLPRPSASERQGLDLWLLDVGQGLALVVRYREHTLVYDTGAGDPAGPNMATAVIVPFLERQGVEEIDLLVLSHGDNDHASGAVALHDRFPVAETWVGERLPLTVPGQRDCRAGDRRHWGELAITVLWPRDAEGEGNNRSCVLVLAFRGRRVLLPGDIEATVEHELLRRQRADLAAEVLLLPHHGSRSSSSSALLHAVAPELVLLSRGYRNRFGHPHGRVLRRLSAFGLPVCDTAEQGAVHVQLLPGRPATVSAWRHKHRFYWAAPASPACSPAYNGAHVE
ncbi:MAG: DNA internalization-related competence protein ComEC/Rec2 [Halieaceae bacterium]|jgi:competence protein ComEC|nr:DNA internalization-related competence protein ComEC/Rec2 [Halieaceae bacterium]